MTLRAGTDTGSMMNHLYSRMTKGQPDPVVGMGATILAWSDRYAGTIETVIPTKDGWRVTVREDKATRVDTNGMSECQEYTYAPNPEGALYRFEFKPAKGWFEIRLNPDTNRWVKTGGPGLRIGERRKYYDFSF